MYTNDKATQIVIALFKAYGIKDIIISPGTRNRGFSASVQNDNFFNAYSVVDERSAGYFACGLAYETGKPVVIACTGATASRNYMPALTEAYYRGLPIIALTCGNENGNPYNMLPQYVDRSVSQNDVKECSVTLPNVKDERSAQLCETLVNAALSHIFGRRRGPVHINLLSLDMDYTTEKLPEVHAVEYFETDDLYNRSKVAALASVLNGKKVGVFVGSHAKMDKSETKALADFAKAYNAIIFCDHTSNYQGDNKVLTAAVCETGKKPSLPEVMIDMGGITATYPFSGKLFKSAEIWRISENGEFKQRYGNVKKFFDCREKSFFAALAKEGHNKNAYFSKENVTNVITNAGSLPLSNTYVASVLSRKLPHNSSLHVSILNSLRNLNLFELDSSVDSTCNVGGFGIDGPVSTLAGQSMADSKRLYFGVVGDLAFFYDMNILGNRHLGRNLRLLVVNNGLGVEFRLDASLSSRLSGEEINKFIAAKGHNGSVKAWAEAMGFLYMSAQTKEEFIEKSDEFCNGSLQHFDRPVVFEVFTVPEDDVAAYRAVCGSSQKKQKVSTVAKVVSCLIPDKEKRRKFRSKHSK
uniref:2-succinyl-5-enolpyruvyl-6-hydroxy-3-cyclohexene-1-carboxylate synthase n=1 Tax=uncultured Alphaproteobacteria bacterium TaxID=91750 RepID=A0A6G8F3C0_9PROT|nr:2-succinyl-5-enolpyruvyl-6-hydroxy-3-cyclohexene- 1-carboxylate synthase [uncultured Alphaproteobacteria bacterium]